MIDWQSIKTIGKSLIVRVSGLPENQVRWKDEAEGSTWVGDPSIWLNISTITQYGWDEERNTVPNSTDDQVINLVQQKGFTWSISAESFTSDIADPKHAGALLDVVITSRLKRSSSEFTIAGIFAIADFRGGMRYAPYVDKSGRRVNRYVQDVICLTVDNDIDDTQGAGGWIKEVIGQGTVNNAVGSTPSTVPYDIKGH